MLFQAYSISLGIFHKRGSLRLRQRMRCVSAIQERVWHLLPRYADRFKPSTPKLILYWQFDSPSKEHSPPYRPGFRCLQSQALPRLLAALVRMGWIGWLHRYNYLQRLARNPPSPELGLLFPIRAEKVEIKRRSWSRYRWSLCWCEHPLLVS